MSQTVTLTPTAVYPPRPGKKYASIKVGTAYYSFDPAKIPLHNFSLGVAATFEHITTDQGYNNITRFISSGAPNNGGGATSQSYGGAAGSGGAAQYRQAMDPAESMKITKLAIAKSCIEGNQTIAVAEQWLVWCLAK